MEKFGGDNDDNDDNTDDTSILEVNEDIEDIEGDTGLELFDEEIERDNEDLENIFGELENTDKNIKTTTREIKDAISRGAYENINNKIVEFDTTKDNNMFDENLKDVYEKIYITNQYIYADDTIKNIRHKICAAIKNNSKFGENSYIIPSYQYLWAEYKFNNSIEKVMVGQKWILKNDLLKLDIEPNTNIIVYEELRGNLKGLRDNIKRQGKIKREDDENNILNDYDGYYTNNEIHMIDLYNELGLNYNPSIEELKNLSDVYLRIYFPYVKLDDFSDIILNLDQNISNSKKAVEQIKNKNIFETTVNDLILENEIMKDLEIVRKKNYKEYTKIFKENYVVQSFIRSYLLKKGMKLDLYRIFDNFVLDDEYPFVQFQTPDGNSKYKYAEEHLFKNVNKDIILKWFETSPYGISFKIRISENDNYKYMAINLSDNGRVDYKIQWKEEDMCTIDDINKTYKYIRKLVEKLNTENSKNNIVFKSPSDDEFDYAFINTIQKFELPDNFSINHNDLSEFSRYFFPYVALVIEPRKRQAKSGKIVTEEKSKYGTYLRYKRVTKYENKTKIEHRIVFFMRNYEYDDQSLSSEISKEFNVTEEQAIIEIQNVREKYPNLKKSRKVLKKLENIPKYKPPGIGIDIQGKSRTNYKMRIAGARNKNQLNRIITFMNILIYLYVETYLYNKPERKRMKDKLNRLTQIAKRRNKVEEIVDYEKDSVTKNIKQMIAIDSKRLGEKGDNENQYSRDCQNSGNDKKRRPLIMLSVDELQQLGYTWREELDGEKYGHYTKTVLVDEDGNINSKKKKSEVSLRAIKLAIDDTGDNFVYYTCSPEENGKHMYVGFLGRSKNPYGDARPCCFIKDQLYSKNDDKRQLYLKSIGLVEKDSEINQISGDQLYILQDSNKVQEGRFAFLPKYLDIFLNIMLGNNRTIENHYLTSSPTGYYFKYGSKQDDFKYLNSIASALDLTVDEIKQKMIKTMESDKCQSIFTSLNNGDIRTQFTKISNYVEYLKNNEYLDFSYVNDLLSIPGVLTPNGINILIFRKKTQLIRKTFEKEKMKENYYVICNNKENILDVTNPKRETIFIMKESKNYYPIIMVKKINPTDKEINITKTFKYIDDNNNIVKHVYNYYKINCRSEFSMLVKEKGINSLNAKEMFGKLLKLNKKEYLPKTQIIDTRYKCKFLVTNGGYIIPVAPSGCIYSIGITANIDNYVKDYSETSKYLKDLPDDLGLKQVGLFYNSKKEKSYNITSILLESYQSLPITHKLFTKDHIKKLGLAIQSKPDDDIVDKEIIKGVKNVDIDKRITSVSKNKYEIEMYQLFRFHLSYFLNNTTIGNTYKNKLENIISNQKIDKNNKKLLIKKILYKMTEKSLFHKFNDLLKKISNEKSGGAIETDHDDKYWVRVSNKKYDYNSFTVKNNRELCYHSNTKDSCNTHQYCMWNSSKNICLLNVEYESIINYINQVSEEFLQNELKASEILKRDKYFVSDIVNYNVYTERSGEKIILSSNVNLQHILSEIFGKENIPKIGRRKTKIESMQNYDQLNYENPLKEFSDYSSQKIIENNNSIYRAFANSYYWLLHPFSENNIRNLGYYSSLQTKLSSQYKSEVIDWLQDPENKSTMVSVNGYFKYPNFEDNIARMSNDIETLTNCIVELFIMAKMYETLIYIYDDNMQIIYMIHPIDGIAYDHKINKKLDNSKYTSYAKIINFKFYYLTKNIYPDRIECIHFK